MEKTMNAPIVILKKGIAPIQNPDESNETNLNAKEDPESKIVFNELGEIEDLSEIYGEMSSIM
jgi:hypothetical protein